VKKTLVSRRLKQWLRAAPWSHTGLAERLKRRWDMRVVLTSGDVEAVRRADPAETVVFKPYTGAQILAALAGRRRED
jgi:hypothetical protein